MNKSRIVVCLIMLAITSAVFGQQFFTSDIAIWRISDVSANRDKIWCYVSDGWNTSNQRLVPNNISFPTWDFDFFSGMDNFGYDADIFYSGISSGDFDGDGRSDIAIISGTTIISYFSNGKEFAFGDDLTESNVYPFEGITSGDFDGNGYDDIAIYCTYSALHPNWDAILLYNWNTTTNTFERRTPLILSEESGNYIGITSGDLNGDGLDDIVVLKSASKIRAFVSTGDDFTICPSSNDQTVFATYPLDLALDGLTAGDFDGDGSDEIAFYENYQDHIYVYQWSNNPSSPLTSVSSWAFVPTGNSISGISSGDFDGDKLKDLAYITGNNVHIYRSDGAHFYDQTEFSFGGYNFNGLACGYFDDNYNSFGNFFPLGWYDDPDRNIGAITDNLPTIASSHANSVIPFSLEDATVPQIENYLSVADGLGLQVMVPINSQDARDVQDNDPLAMSRITTVVNDLVNPTAPDNLLGWYLADEPENMYDLTVTTLSNIAANIAVADGGSHDPSNSIWLESEYPIFIVGTRADWEDSLPTDPRSYAIACNSAMWDRYPYDISDNPDLLRWFQRLPKVVTVHSRRQHRNMPIVAVIQGYGYNQWESIGTNGILPPNESGGVLLNMDDPTLIELRYMTYKSIVEGARGIFYWDLFRTRQEIYNDITTVLNELNTNNIPDIVMLDPIVDFVRSNHDRRNADGNENYDLLYIFRYDESNNWYYLIAVNDSNTDMDGVNCAVFSFPTNFTIAGITDRLGTIVNSHTDHTFTDDIPALGVRVYRISRDLSKSVVGNAVNTTTPEYFSLNQNYPNPFNPQTTIQYSLPQSDKVVLSIYNINGQLIETLVNETKDAGTYSVTWDGSRWGSGVYFYKIETSEHTQVNKMVLVK